MSFEVNIWKTEEILKNGEKMYRELSPETDEFYKFMHEAGACIPELHVPGKLESAGIPVPDA